MSLSRPHADCLDACPSRSSWQNQSSGDPQVAHPHRRKARLVIGRSTLSLRLPRRLVCGRPARIPIGNARLVPSISGTALALWIIGYGIVQATAPSFLGLKTSNQRETHRRPVAGKILGIWKAALFIPGWYHTGSRTEHRH